MLPPLDRLPTLHHLIDRGKYIALHAPRQVGKTTSLSTLAMQLTSEGRYAAVLVSMETGAPANTPTGMAEDAILDDWRDAILAQLPPELQPPAWPDAPPQRRIGMALSTWARACPRPLVVFLDEIDSLDGAKLVSVLRQLRSGYIRRPGAFPWALALCGMRDVRDDRVDFEEPERSHSASPFNIKESLGLRNFNAAEVASLYQQHTEQTGQAFTLEAVQRAFTLSGGHPWLVNALGAQLMDFLVPDRQVVITAEHVERAKEEIILRRETHLDSLIERLRMPRVRRVIEPILVGENINMNALNDDIAFVRDLGLVVDRPNLRIANPIYAEIIPRALSYRMQINMVQEVAWYLRPDGSLDMILLLAAFQEFFAEHSESWLGRFDYQEAGPHLFLMAFLQRIVNGGGRITREFAVGSGRADLVVEYAGRRDVLELKIYHGSHTEKQAVEQLSGYLERLGEREAYLVLFDRGLRRSWADKIYIKEVEGLHGERLHVFGA